MFCIVLFNKHCVKITCVRYIADSGYLSLSSFTLYELSGVLSILVGHIFHTSEDTQYPSGESFSWVKIILTQGYCHYIHKGTDNVDFG